MSKFEEHPAVAAAVACKYCSLVLTWGSDLIIYNRNVPFHNGKWILYPIVKPHEILYMYVYDHATILLDIMKFKILLLASIILTFLHTCDYCACNSVQYCAITVCAPCTFAERLPIPRKALNLRLPYMYPCTMWCTYMH